MSKKNLHRRFSQDFSEGGKTQQHFKDSCNVNTIVSNFAQTGHDPYAERIGKQIFGYATSQSYDDAMRQTAEVHSTFAGLPSEIRSHFKNDPSAWLDHHLALQAETPEKIPPESPQEPSSPNGDTPVTPDPGEPTTPAKKDG